ncbi:uncharacterized protein LOC141698670 [Apium graveolens]|uniref:uncharacterized protein LOC141698670 n=1 Tax=Apium graveolens TaxID=4045 RepID=UPI003D7BF597
MGLLEVFEWKKEKVVVVDYFSSEDEEQHKSHQEALERLTVSRAAKMTFESNKNDREELFAFRKKVQGVSIERTRRGLYWEELEKSYLLNEEKIDRNTHVFNKQCSERDEYSLPLRKKSGLTEDGAFVDTMFEEQIMGESNYVKESRNFGLPDEGDSGVKNSQDKCNSDDARVNITNEVFDGKSKRTGENYPDKPKSWSQIVNDAPLKKKAKFTFILMPEGLKVVSPSDELLKRG